MFVFYILKRKSIDRIYEQINGVLTNFPHLFRRVKFLKNLKFKGVTYRFSTKCKNYLKSIIGFTGFRSNFSNITRSTSWIKFDFVEDVYKFWK